MLGERVVNKHTDTRTGGTRYQKKHNAFVRLVTEVGDRTKGGEAEKNEKPRQHLSPAELAELKKIEVMLQV